MSPGDQSRARSRDSVDDEPRRTSDESRRNEPFARAFWGDVVLRSVK
jgi:hypothetical protein